MKNITEIDACRYLLCTYVPTHLLYPIQSLCDQFGTEGKKKKKKKKKLLQCLCDVTISRRAIKSVGFFRCGAERKRKVRYCR